MLFNSLQFGVFFVLVTAAYFVLPHKHRWFMLLAASCYFYMAFVPAYILILFFTITIDYISGLMIEQARGRRRRLILTVSIVSNLSVLAIFKYFNFLNGNFEALATVIGWNYPVENLAIILPIGLSFHTFQSLSYVIEVYFGRQKAERHLGIFALYVMFYPQLVAGPIERPQNMLHQFYEAHQFEYDRVTSGLRLMAWGLFKKMVIADRMAVVVDTIYGNPQGYGGFGLMLATYCFAIQIYCDFSGYSDIAIGSARVMGFRLMENFRQPYLASSVQDFWRRWHISLSTWFKDYVYVPLGGNRGGHRIWMRNTLIVFMLSGLWHGASWTFVIWGALHGLYIILGSLAVPWLERLRHLLRISPSNLLWHTASVLLTFHLVTFAWIFFRASSLADAWYIVTHLFVDFQPTLNMNIGLGVIPALIVGGCIVLMESIEWGHRSGRLQVRGLPTWVRWSGYYVVVMLIVLFGVLQSDAQFIYFQF